MNMVSDFATVDRAIFQIIHYTNVFSLKPRMTLTRTPTFVSPQ